MMPSRILEIRVESAQNLPQVRRRGRQMKVFTEVSISGRPNTMQKTSVDEIRGSNPIWKCPMNFTINNNMLLNLHFQIYCKCFAGRKRLIGEVYEPVREHSDKLTDLEFQRDVMTPSGEAHGKLIFTYVVKQEPSLPPPPAAAEENGHQHGEKRKFLSTVFTRILVSAAVASSATVAADAVGGDF